MSKKNTYIKINVSLDDNKVAEKIKWSAPDGGVENKEAKANEKKYSRLTVPPNIWFGFKGISKNESITEYCKKF